jgi:ABC-type bacteriocin/lantibiotic exporter with double-glycine peptidase domain
VSKITVSRENYRRIFRVLDVRQKRILSTLVFSQLFLGILDFIGVLLVGVIGAIAIASISNVALNQSVLRITNIIKIDEFSTNIQLTFLGSTVVLIFLIKTLSSILLTKRIMLFMGKIATELSAKLISESLNRPLLFLENESSQKRLFAITRGVDYLTLFVLGPAVVFLADTTILAVFTLGLVLVQPKIALIFIITFGVISFFIYRKLHARSGDLGVLSAALNVEVSEKINEAFDLYREIVVRHGRVHYVEAISSLRTKLAISTAEFNLIPYIGKYSIEGTVIFAAVILTVSQILINDAVSGVTTLVVFLAASTRIAPAILRVQQGTIMIRGNIGMCTPTLDLIDKLVKAEKVPTITPLNVNNESDFSPTVSIKSLCFSYSEDQKFVIKNLNLEIRHGEKIALVGPSGSGKSTLIDLILGILSPQSGEILISGMPPIQSFALWPGATAYVPQSSGMINGSVLENLVFGLSSDEWNSDQVQLAISKAALSQFIQDHPEGINAQIGERGSRLSAGQRQRLGIARALITKPKLLVLDEATSALDGVTEEIVSKSLENLGPLTTVIMIAHRLSTVQHADRVVYLENGDILAQGTFQEVRSQIPDFNKQAKLMGL